MQNMWRKLLLDNRLMFIFVSFSEDYSCLFVASEIRPKIMPSVSGTKTFNQKLVARMEQKKHIVSQHVPFSVQWPSSL